MVVNTLIKKLLHNVKKEDIKSKYPSKQIDLVIDGGAFNGSYVIGVLYYLKEMEKQKYLSISRISGCSVGSLCGFLYLIDKIDEGVIYYQKLRNSFLVNNNLISLYEWFDNFKKTQIEKDTYLKVSNKLIITYFDTIKMKTIVKEEYSSNDELIDCLIKTSFLPFIGNGNNNYKNCIDGGVPYLLKPYIKNDKLVDNKIIYIHLTSLDRIVNCFIVKNEINSYERIFDGINMTHNFFFKDRKNSLISCVNKWNYNDYIIYYIKQIIVLIVYYILLYSIEMYNNLPYSIRCNVFINEIITIFNNLFFSLTTKLCFN